MAKKKYDENAPRYPSVQKKIGIKKKTNSSSIEKAFDVLGCFDDKIQYLRFKDFHQKLELKKGTLHRLLSLLKKKRMIYQNPSSKQYCLGPGVVELAWNILSRQDLRSLALNYMLQLRELAEETIGLYIRIGDQRICIEEVESLHGLRYNAKVGLSVPLYVGAPGKVILAFLPDQKLNEILQGMDFKPYTPNTITSAKQLRRDLIEVRKNGYSATTGERTIGVVGIAAPIMDRTAEVVAAMSVIGPSERLNPIKVKTIAPQLINTCRNLSQALGCPKESLLSLS